MKNSSENFGHVFDKEPEESRPDRAEELVVFNGESDGAGLGRERGEKIISSDGGGGVPYETSRLKTLRQELVRSVAKTEGGFKLLAPENSAFKSVAETANIRPYGKFIKFMRVAMAGLGLLASDKLQAADSQGVSLKSDAVSAGVPVFKAPTQPNSSTNVYNYQSETWQPKTEAEKEKTLKERAVFEAQAAAPRPKKSSGAMSYGQYNQHGKNPVVNVAASPGVNHNRLINTGHYPRHNEGQFPNAANRQIPEDAVVVQGRGGFYSQPHYPQQNFNYGSNRRYPRMPGTVYYGVPPGGQIPTEERKLFGEKFQAITRDAALGISGSDRRGGNYRGRYDSTPRSKKPKSR